MRIALPRHAEISVDSSSEWVADEVDPKAADFGLYLRSVEFGFYLNVRSQAAGVHPLTRDGLVALLREQQWASAPFDEWTSDSGTQVSAGGVFETEGMRGEVVLEVFVTDGHVVVNFAGPADRAVLAAALPAVRRLITTLRFEAPSD